MGLLFRRRGDFERRKLGNGVASGAGETLYQAMSEFISFPGLWAERLMETLGVNLTEGKTLLAGVHDFVVTQQAR